MDYHEVKLHLEATKSKLTKKMDDPNLSEKEKEKIQHSIMNYEYIIELTEMNHFERGPEAS